MTSQIKQLHTGVGYCSDEQQSQSVMFEQGICLPSQLSAHRLPKWKPLQDRGQPVRVLQDIRQEAPGSTSLAARLSTVQAAGIHAVPAASGQYF